MYGVPATGLATILLYHGLVLITFTHIFELHLVQREETNVGNHIRAESVVNLNFPDIPIHFVMHSIDSWYDKLYSTRFHPDNPGLHINLRATGSMNH